MKVEVNNETPNLLSFLIRFVCGISHAGVNYTNPAVNLGGVLYFGIFLKNIPFIYRNGGSNKNLDEFKHPNFEILMIL
jgi:hypothetical protein